MQVWTTPEATTCQCTEAFVPVYRDGVEDGQRRLTAAHLHNCRYIARRNALIPIAQKIAKLIAPHGGDAWATAYSAAMERLVREARAGGSL